MNAGQREDGRRFGPNSRMMKATYERIRLMCQDARYTQHEINQRHVLPLDAAVWLRFAWVKHEGVTLHIELTRHGKQTRDGLLRWWPVIEQWYHVVSDLQGPWIQGGLSRFLEFDLPMWHEQEGSYPKLAARLNLSIRSALQDAHRLDIARELLQYFSPKIDFDTILQDPASITKVFPITASDVRERLRYRKHK